MKKYFKEFFATSGDWEGLPVVTSCTIMSDDGSFFRGVSVLGQNEHPNGETGRQYAERYALRAMKGRGGRRRSITDPRAISTLLRTDCGFRYHEDRLPILTLQEQKALLGKQADAYKPPIAFAGLMNDVTYLRYRANHGGATTAHNGRALQK